MRWNIFLRQTSLLRTRWETVVASNENVVVLYTSLQLIFSNKSFPITKNIARSPQIMNFLVDVDDYNEIRIN